MSQEPPAAGQISSGDTAWVLAASALVLLMTPGLAFFYGGLVRHSNVLNTMMMSLISMGVVGVLWTLLGFTLAYGEGNAFIGDFSYLGLEGLDERPWRESTVPGLVFATFNMTFAIIAAAIISGAIVERMRFGAYVLLISLWSLLVYAPLAHWVWGGGWLEELGALDFAGGTVVHISSSVSAVVAAVVLGKRAGGDDPERAGPHNVPFVILGGSLLWFGWAGFNGGSAYAADMVAARAIATTFIAASSAMVARVAVERSLDSRATTLGAINGSVAGLVTITPAAGFVSPLGALVMGAVGALACMGATRLLERCRFLDDSLDCFGIHGVGGIAGAILTGLFAIDGGLFYGGGWRLVWVQTVGALAGVAFSGLATLVILAVMCLFMRIRATPEDEQIGLDLPTHGEAAYGGAAGELHKAISQATLKKALSDYIEDSKTLTAEDVAKLKASSAAAQDLAAAEEGAAPGSEQETETPGESEASATGPALQEV